MCQVREPAQFGAGLFSALELGGAGKTVQSLRVLDQAAGEARPGRGTAGARNHHPKRGRYMMIGAKCSVWWSTPICPGRACAT